MIGLLNYVGYICLDLTDLPTSRGIICYLREMTGLGLGLLVGLGLGTSRSKL